MGQGAGHGHLTTQPDSSMPGMAIAIPGGLSMSTERYPRSRSSALLRLAPERLALPDCSASGSGHSGRQTPMPGCSGSQHDMLTHTSPAHCASPVHSLITGQSVSEEMSAQTEVGDSTLWKQPQVSLSLQNAHSSVQNALSAEQVSVTQRLSASQKSVSRQHWVASSVSQRKSSAGQLQGLTPMSGFSPQKQ